VNLFWKFEHCVTFIVECPTKMRAESFSCIFNLGYEIGKIGYPHEFNANHAFPLDELRKNIYWYKVCLLMVSWLLLAINRTLGVFRSHLYAQG